jgi:hypothetical protein
MRNGMSAIGPDSGPSRGDLYGPAFRPIETIVGDLASHRPRPAAEVPCGPQIDRSRKHILSCYLCGWSARADGEAVDKRGLRRHWHAYGGRSA